MIKRIYIDNYRCFTNFEAQLKELTVLLGPNGAGKSSIFDIVFSLRNLLSGLSKINGEGAFHPRTLTRWTNRTTQTVEFDAEIDRETFTYRLEIDHNLEKQVARVLREDLKTVSGPLFGANLGEVQLYNDHHLRGPQYSSDWSESALCHVPSRPSNKKLTRFLEFVRNIAVVRLSPTEILPEAREEDSSLDRSGKNFAAWYRHVSQERLDLAPEYAATLKEVLDGFRSIRLEKIGLGTRAFMLQFEHAEQKYDLQLDELSDGQRALVVLYALTRMTSSRGNALFIDEPDNFVALAEIQPWLNELEDVCGSNLTQVVICSHHPEIVDYLGPDHGVFLRRLSSGAVSVQPAGQFRSEGKLKLSEKVARGWSE